MHIKLLDSEVKNIIETHFRLALKQKDELNAKQLVAKIKAAKISEDNEEELGLLTTALCGSPNYRDPGYNVTHAIKLYEALPKDLQSRFINGCQGLEGYWKTANLGLSQLGAEKENNCFVAMHLAQNCSRDELSSVLNFLDQVIKKFTQTKTVKLKKTTTKENALAESVRSVPLSERIHRLHVFANSLRACAPKVSNESKDTNIIIPPKIRSDFFNAYIATELNLRSNPKNAITKLCARLQAAKDSELFYWVDFLSGDKLAGYGFDHAEMCRRANKSINYSEFQGFLDNVRNAEEDNNIKLSKLIAEHFALHATDKQLREIARFIHRYTEYKKDKDKEPELLVKLKVMREIIMTKVTRIS